MSRSPPHPHKTPGKTLQTGELAVPKKEGLTGSSGSLTIGRPKSPAFRRSPSTKHKSGHWFSRKDGTKSDSEVQDSDIHEIHQKQFTNVLAQIREKSKMSRRRSKTAETFPTSSSSSVGLDGSPGSQGHLSSSVGSTELFRGRSSTTLSATDEENADLDSLDGLIGPNDKENFDEIDAQVDSEKIAHAIERLKRKITKTKEQIRQLQEERDESVKEYLESTEGTQIQAKVKTHFEKKNQKTNNIIAQSQRKLQKYHKALLDLEENGTLSSNSKVMAKEVLKGVKDNFRGISDGVKDGVKGAVAKPLEIANLIKNKFGSSENVAATLSPGPGSKTDGLEDDPTIVLPSEDSDQRFGSSDSDRPYPQTVHSPNYISDDDSSSAASNAPTSQPTHQSSPRHSLPPSPPTSCDQEINELRENQSRLSVHIDSLKEQVELLARSLQEERYKSEHLQCQLSDLTSQWNDMTELHQNEMMSLKIELERAEERMECVEYRLSERAGEIEEALDSYVTRISKVETVQQQNQQMVGALDEYLEQSVQAKALLSKFLSVILAVLAIILIIFTSIGRLIVPFTRTRPRLMVTGLLAVLLLVAWKYQDSDLIVAICVLLERNSERARDVFHSLSSPFRRLFFKDHKS